MRAASALEMIRGVEVPVLLVSTYLFLIPFGRLSTVPMVIMALLGIRTVVKDARIFRYEEIRSFSLVFLCFFVPILISAVDAVNVGKTINVLLVYLQCYLAGVYIVSISQRGALPQDRIIKILSYVVVFWMVDGVFQLSFGFNLIGFPLSTPEFPYFNGIFGSHNPKFGIYLAILSPLVFIYARKNWHPILHLIIVCSASSLVFLSGRRSAWIMLMVVLTVYMIWLVFVERKLRFRWLLIASVLILGCFASVYYLSPVMTARVDMSMRVFDGNLNSVDAAISQRLPIWRVAVAMIKEHPINGVGARGFRYAYASFAEEKDHFVGADSIGAFQAHQLLLDIGSNTGFIGLFGFLLAISLVVRRWLSADLSVRESSLPYAASLLAVFFPLNTHMATYSSQWAMFFFWLIALFFSVQNVAIPRKRPHTADSGKGEIDSDSSPIGSEKVSLI